jgi:hypothetical protein
VDFYQGVVVDYLRANRTTFVNTEYCIQLNKSDNPDTSGPHWYCDAVALEFQSSTIFLCEISYERSLASLIKRLRAWHEHWDLLREAVARDASFPQFVAGWPLRPWLFIPNSLATTIEKVLDQIAGDQQRKFSVRLTPLEMVQPWQYRSWDRKGEGEKQDVPEAMRS